MFPQVVNIKEEEMVTTLTAGFTKVEKDELPNNRSTEASSHLEMFSSWLVPIFNLLTFLINCVHN